jgi:hypothetical protein
MTLRSEYKFTEAPAIVLPTGSTKVPWTLPADCAWAEGATDKKISAAVTAKAPARISEPILIAATPYFRVTTIDYLHLLKSAGELRRCSVIQYFRRVCISRSPVTFIIG